MGLSLCGWIPSRLSIADVNTTRTTTTESIESVDAGKMKTKKQLKLAICSHTARSTCNAMKLCGGGHSRKREGENIDHSIWIKHKWTRTHASVSLTRTENKTNKSQSLETGCEQSFGTGSHHYASWPHARSSFQSKSKPIQHIGRLFFTSVALLFGFGHRYDMQTIRLAVPRSPQSYDSKFQYSIGWY